MRVFIDECPGYSVDEEGRVWSTHRSEHVEACGEGIIMNDQAIVRSGGTGIVREGFAGRELERRGELSTSALVAAARAEIESRYIMALQRPRSWDDVRVKLLKACERPSFAAGAIYSLPKGNKPGRITGTPGRIEGLSIRFAEEAMRDCGNIFQKTATTYDDDFKRTITVSAADLESNAIYSTDIVIDKTVERSELKKDATLLGQRTNSAGNRVYILAATEEELLQKSANMASRALRTEVLRLVPADILEECEKRIAKTRKEEIKRDPDGVRKSIVDGFASLNVMPSELEAYLGHPLASAAPAELEDLRGLFSAVRDGEVTFAEALKAVTSVRDVEAKPEDDQAKAAAAKGQSVIGKIRKHKEKVAHAKASASPPAPAAASRSSPPVQASLPVSPPTSEVAKGEAKREREPGEEG